MVFTIASHEIDIGAGWCIFVIICRFRNTFCNHNPIAVNSIGVDIRRCIPGQCNIGTISGSGKVGWRIASIQHIIDGGQGIDASGTISVVFRGLSTTWHGCGFNDGVDFYWGQCWVG